MANALYKNLKGNVQQLCVFSWNDVNVKSTVKPFFTVRVIFVLSRL